MIQNRNLLIISVKPEYAKKILKGEKTIELRKCAPKKVGKNGHVLMYVTAPIKELWGVYKIEDIIIESPTSLWNRFGDKTGVTREEFKEYYKENKNAFGLELKEVKNLFRHSIKLNDLKSLIPNFTPPQTYSYISADLINYSWLKKIIS